MRKLIVLFALLVSISQLSTAEAASFPVIRGTLVDANSSPLKNVKVTAFTAGFITDVCTDVQGRFALQVKANKPISLTFNGAILHNRDTNTWMGCESNSSVNNLVRADVELAGISSDINRTFTVPAKFPLKFHVIDDNGQDVFGATVSSPPALPYQPVANSGFTSIVWSHDNTDLVPFSTDITGRATVPLLTLLNDAVIQDELCAHIDDAMYSPCAPNAPVQAARMISKDFDEDGKFDFVSVSYTPRPGIWLREMSNMEDWIDGDATVVIPYVPQISVSVPNQASLGSQVTATSIATTNVATFSTSPFRNKSANLYGRDYSKPTKPGAWKKLGSCKYGADAKCKVKFKMGKTVQVQFRPVGFSSTLKSKVIKKK